MGGWIKDASPMIPPAQHLLVDPSHNRNNSNTACTACTSRRGARAGIAIYLNASLHKYQEHVTEIDGQTLASHRNPSPRLCPAVAANNKSLIDRRFAMLLLYLEPTFPPTPCVDPYMFTLSQTTSCAFLYYLVTNPRNMCAIKI